MLRDMGRRLAITVILSGIILGDEHLPCKHAKLAPGQTAKINR